MSFEDDWADLRPAWWALRVGRARMHRAEVLTRLAFQQSMEDLKAQEDAAVFGDLLAASSAGV